MLKDNYNQILTSRKRKNPQKQLHLEWPEMRTISTTKGPQLRHLKDKKEYYEMLRHVTEIYETVQRSHTQTIFFFLSTQLKICFLNKSNKQFYKYFQKL